MNAGLGETLLGRWLGVSHCIGPLMSYWVLTADGNVLSRTTVQRVTNLELQTAETVIKCQAFDARVKERLDDPETFLEDATGKVVPGDWVLDDKNDPDFNEEFNKVISDDSVPEADAEFTPDVFDDTYLHMELALPKSGGEVEFGRVVKRLRDKDGLPIGTAHDNPILDTRVYEVEFSDGHRASLAANIIAENLYSQVDPEGNRHVMFDNIIDHRTNGKQLLKDDAFITTSTGTKRRRETTSGWELLIPWKDNSTT